MPKAARSERRDDALSRERIVSATIELLDDTGEEGLTFRALATRLSTGPGAIYWYVKGKSELLVAASDEVILRALTGVGESCAPREAILGIAGRVFDAMDAHPWVGAQLSREPWQTAVRQVFEQLGRQLLALRVPPRSRFAAASTLLSYVLGASHQNAVNGRLLEPSVNRTEFLRQRWSGLDPAEYPFTTSVVPQLLEHDDRAEFLAGIELILAGIARTAGPA